ncbi:MAG: imidazolonepropionase [candidate division WOR-3 bacterium]|nr:imidazolonepropionase [candidate division WOR-3 bacterium]
MKTSLIKNARQILTLSGQELGIINNGSIVIKDGKIAEIIQSSKLNQIFGKNQKPKVIDAKRCVVMPGFVDCHTHLVFAGSRENEFVMRLEGKSYKEILSAGGGILQTVKHTQMASEKELISLAQKRIDELIKWGTTTVEIKSGYGLNTEHELKILRVIKKLQKKNQNRITIVPTFLGAHAVPLGIEKSDYIKTVINEMIPKVAKQKLSDFCDVFCENFVFNAKESLRILSVAKKFGLTPKIHADEIESSGGSEVAGKIGAISAEHLLYPSKNGLKKMKEQDVTAVLLPGTSLFLKSKVIPPIEEMRRLGLSIALGSDYNPGTCMIYQMPIIIALGCLLYGLTLTEAIRGATINSAKALGLDKSIGSIEVGKEADIIILDVPDYKHIPYQFGKNLIKIVMKRGVVIYKS